ncbi:MAG TPA: pyruvate kinase [Candidatus Angelobacter sp.]|nr:pyruvate kinase [Candidatus Angelobacter sp.]
MRRAKIVCTLGPAVASQAGIASLVEAGMDVARMNLSHGTYADHERIYEWVRTAADVAGRGVGIMVDLQGPKIRLGTFASGPVVLEVGAEFTITVDDVPGDATICSTTYDGLPGDVHPGDSILIDDGKVALEAVEVGERSVRTRVVEGGRISDHKGINLPGVAVSVPAMSEKDVADLRWALRLGVDMIALSFVRRADDLLDVVRIMDDEGVRLPVLAKIEKPQAVDNLEAIIDAFDGIMVARGDLGVELPLEQVPLVQKRAVTLARRRAKPVIVATQMLDSMVSMTRPTRAEASDVANAVLDGTDALMLSGETSVGSHPAHVVRTMARIIEQVEGEALDQLPQISDRNDSTSRSITHAAVTVGTDVGATAVIAFTETGRSARLVARYRPDIALLAFTPNPRVRSQLALSWGVETFLVPKAASTDEMVRLVDAALLDIGRAKVGELIIVIAGVPPGIPGTTNGMRVHRVGTSVASGI